MLTFTLPAQLRTLVKAHDKSVYTMMFEVLHSLLFDFAKRHKQLNNSIGFTAVLHTHSRQLQFHPHLHVVLPAGAFNAKTQQWQKAKGNYLFNVKALSKVWRARMLERLCQQFHVPPTPKNWVVNCQAVGQGAPALKYLSRYLYRGVIQECNILGVHNNLLTFQYQDSQTKQMKTQTLPVLAFLWRVLQHVLPKGFRRTRQYGLLASANRLKLKRIQLLLKVIIFPFKKTKAATRPCPKCKHAMQFIDILPMPDS
ncbi:putative transposase [Catenovulum agarivorans DS-2]|uniref:Putative transposase n=2 Tax=Catenovulum agarivorans TaxID=1172192 RepID=W7Q817_9ALTE|nr:putative transposase [Catenovulum agarivorans DS-2]